MSCPLTSNYALPCRDSIGGIKKLYIATLADYEALVETVSGGDITEFGSPSLVFQSYEQLKETSTVTETITASIQNGTVYMAPEVSVVLPKLATATRDEIKLLAQNRVVIMYTTNDETPNTFVVGRSNGLEITAGTAATGTAFGDLQGYTLTFSGMEPAMSLKLTPTSGTVQAMIDAVTEP
jgi:hypothetical protein